MRGLVRRSVSEEEEESSFVSMTDMTVSFLFIVMILLAFFAAQYQDSDLVPRAELDKMRKQRDDAQAEVAALRKELASVQEELDKALKARDEALEKVRILESDLAKARRAVATLEAEREWLRERIVDLNKRIDVLLARVVELHDDIGELERRIKALLAEIRELKKRNPLEAYLTDAATARRTILERLRGALKRDFSTLVMEISDESDALRFQGEGLFRTGQHVLLREQRKIVETIALRLDEILPCYTLGEHSLLGNDECGGTLAIIESVQIEGHTDSRGSDVTNLQLSTNRANTTFFTMVRHVPRLNTHKNYRNQPVLSVAGYGPMRPVASNDTVEGLAANRRIDLRIIMYTPKNTDDAKKVKDRLREKLGAENAVQ